MTTTTRARRTDPPVPGRENRTREALDAVQHWLAKVGIDVHGLEGVELFAGDGRMQAMHYVDRLAAVELWEYDGARCAVLRDRFPRARVRHVDSIELTERGAGRRFDFVAVDNPLGPYGPDDRYCEHFELLPRLHRLLADRAVVLLNVVPRPYDADRHPGWMARRADFYGVDAVHDLDIDFLVSHYTDRFAGDGWLTTGTFPVCREYDAGVDYFWYIAFVLERPDKADRD